LKFLNDVVKAFNKDPTPLTKDWNYVNNVVGKLKTVGNLVAHPEPTDESLEKVRVKKLINHAITAVKGRAPDIQLSPKLVVVFPHLMAILRAFPIRFQSFLFPRSFLASGAEDMS
jgi:hypothetical protein